MIKVTLKNPRTGELKQIKVGFSWTLFFFAGVLGIPLFLRKLYVWGGLAAIMYLGGIFFFPLLIPSFFLILFLSIKGNELTAKNYLEHGWTFENPSSTEVKFAKAKWLLALDDAPAGTQEQSIATTKAE